MVGGVVACERRASFRQFQCARFFAKGSGKNGQTLDFTWFLRACKAVRARDFPSQAESGRTGGIIGRSGGGVREKARSEK